MDRYQLDRYQLDRYQLDRYQLDRYQLDRYQLDLTTSAGQAGRSAADEAVDHLRAADRLPLGDSRRHASQRAAARLIADHPEVLQHAALAPAAQQLWAWARLVPFLLPDQREDDLGERTRTMVASQLAALRALDDDPATSTSTASTALLGLDTSDAATRRAADRLAHRCAQRRAPVVADVLSTLAAGHLADDAERGIAEWRTRFAIVNGTSTETLAHVRDSAELAIMLARDWWNVRASRVGHEYSDRRVGLTCRPSSLTAQAAAAVEGIAAGSPRLAAAAAAGAEVVRAGDANRMTVEADGRLAATVVHRPTMRGALMVAHETGHAMHAHAARGAAPPGSLVGETVACWAALVTGLHAAEDSPAMALALGDTLVEELFVSAAVSTFEDRLYCLAGRGVVTADQLNVEWLAVHRSLWGDVAMIPDQIATGWARLPSLATAPGHACSYVWATVLALAARARHGSDPHGCIAAAAAAGGIDADEFARRLGFTGDEWVEVGLTELAVVLAELARRVGTSATATTATMPAGVPSGR